LHRVVSGAEFVLAKADVIHTCRRPLASVIKKMEHECKKFGGPRHKPYYSLPKI